MLFESIKSDDTPPRYAERYLLGRRQAQKNAHQESDRIFTKQNFPKYHLGKCQG